MTIDGVSMHLLEGIRATRVEGAEELLRQGEYYIAGGRIVLNCPNCRASNMMPDGVKFSAGKWWHRILGIHKGLTIGTMGVCYVCQHGFRIKDSEIFISDEKQTRK